MSTVYIIRDDSCHTWGVVENKREVAPFIILTGVLNIYDSADNDFDIADLLECWHDEQEVIEYLKNTSFQMQKIIFEKFGIFITEEKVWSYENYLHDRG